MINEASILYSSAQLCQLDDALQPCAVGSGCLVQLSDGRTLILTAAHVTRNGGNWAIQLEYDRKHGAKCYQIGALNYVTRLTLPSSTSAEVDFAYALVPNDICAYRHLLTPSGDTVAKHNVPVYTGPFTNVPSTVDSFAFAGAVKPQIAPNILQSNRPILDAELRAYTGLKYLRTDGDFHVFKLPFGHPGHIHFKGCSGAPILSSAGVPVALVTSGLIDTDEIFGVALDRLMSVVEATL